MPFWHLSWFNGVSFLSVLNCPLDYLVQTRLCNLEKFKIWSGSAPRNLIHFPSLRLIPSKIGFKGYFFISAWWALMWLLCLGMSYYICTPCWLKSCEEMRSHTKHNVNREYQGSLLNRYTNPAFSRPNIIALNTKANWCFLSQDISASLFFIFESDWMFSCSF